MRSPREIQTEVAADKKAAARVFKYLDDRGIQHSAHISGATLAAVLGVESRTWRRYVGEDRELPTMGRRLLSLVSGVDCEQRGVSRAR
jgi:hypothetical protein